MITYRRLFLEYVSDESCRENNNTYVMFNKFTFFRMSCSLWGNVEKYGTDRRSIDGNIIQRRKHSICIPDN